MKQYFYVFLIIATIAHIHCSCDYTTPIRNSDIDIPCPLRRQNIDLKIRPGYVKPPRVHLLSHRPSDYSINVACPNIRRNKIRVYPGSLQHRFSNKIQGNGYVLGRSWHDSIYISDSSESNNKDSSKRSYDSDSESSLTSTSCSSSVEENISSSSSESHDSDISYDSSLNSDSRGAWSYNSRSSSCSESDSNDIRYESSSSNSDSDWSHRKQFNNCNKRKTICNSNYAVHVPCPARRQNIDVKIRPGYVKAPHVNFLSHDLSDSQSIEVACPNIGPQLIKLCPAHSKPRINYKFMKCSCSSSSSSSSSSDSKATDQSSSSSDSESSSSCS